MIYTGINCEPIIKQNDGKKSKIKVIKIKNLTFITIRQFIPAISLSKNYKLILQHYYS